MKYNHQAEETGTEWGPTFTTDDTVGAGINLEKQEIFFTCAPHPQTFVDAAVLHLIHRHLSHSCTQYSRVDLSLQPGTL